MNTGTKLLDHGADVGGRGIERNPQAARQPEHPGKLHGELRPRCPPPIPRPARPRGGPAPCGGRSPPASRSWPRSRSPGRCRRGRTCGGCSGSPGTRRRAPASPAPGNRTRTMRMVSSRLAPLKPGAMASIRKGVARTPASDQHGGGERQDRKHGAGHAARFLLVLARKQVRVDRDERGREHALAEQVLEEIGDAEGGIEGVGGVRCEAEVVGEDAQAHQAHDAAEQDPSRHQEGGTAGRFVLPVLRQATRLAWRGGGRRGRHQPETGRFAPRRDPARGVRCV